MNLSDKDAIVELLKAFDINKADIVRVLGVEKISDYAGTTQQATALLLNDALLQKYPQPPEGTYIQITVPILGYPCQLSGDSSTDLLYGYAHATMALLTIDTSNLARFLTASVQDEKHVSNPVESTAPVPGTPVHTPPPATTQGGYPPTSSAPPQHNGHHTPDESPEDGTVKQGIEPLHAITVNEKGYVKFQVGNWKWPFTDARGAEAVAAVFDQDLGWKPEHFAPMRHYSEEYCAGLFVSWEKPGKYYNVIRVFKKL